MYSSFGEIIEGVIVLLGFEIFADVAAWNSTILKSYAWLIFFK